MPKEVFKDLNRSWVDGHPIKILEGNPTSQKEKKQTESNKYQEKKKKEEKKEVALERN